ncbi:efflux transporter outer membrane subunit [Propionivibrio dicarboxylicus]|uniref:Efflux transporter, outer membrane factor (OMF) lipoprotein, NodT family n=1 Tax=Propionivibrio dicarboxylicus TaxID=83767 RepID=A0A1G8H930_9RHOO|nr:efflux transporter outer membrane subunit [Propionivibrio dicarboxylicus]SDI03089.1 efflux transporter, outer membrane factor (OMF) lipoprotein, NodT family [Propionivibrio dicarboxylicus]
MLWSLTAAFLPGCMTKRSTYDVPEIPLSAKFHNEKKADEGDTASSSKTGATTQSNEDAGFADWWRFFGNNELEGLINRGLANNPDVRIATIRLSQAKVRSDQAAGGLLPSLSSPMVIARQMPGGYVGSVPVGATGRDVTTAIQGSLRGDWRADIWGEQTALLESTQLQLWRAAFERDNVQRNVTAAIASSYIEFVTLNDRLRVAQETERTLSKTLRIAEERLKIGDATAGEVEQQRAVVFALRATIPTMEQQRIDAINTLAFMVGTVPGALKLSDQGLESLAVPEIVPGLPSSLLLRRPDVKMAEARLLSADADIDVARARILPPLDLTTQAGYSANYLAQFFQPQQFFWTAIANLTTSIFDGGRRRGEKKYAEAVYEEMVETYARTIYQAIREVESALSSVNLANKRLQAQQDAAGAAKRGWELNLKAFAIGGVDQTALLDSERNYHRMLDEYQRSQMEQYRGYISLFQALGGGVRPAGTIPGDGRRPTVANNGPAVSGGAGRAAVPLAARQADGMDWQLNGAAASGGAQIEKFWQIELPGLYHRTTVGAAWRDLRDRYPQLMSGRIVRPRLSGKIDDSGEGGQEAWYRLYIAKFDDESEAQKFCDAMLAAQERCRVVSSQGDEKSGDKKIPLAQPPVAGKGTATDSAKAPAEPTVETASAQNPEAEAKHAPLAAVSKQAIRSGYAVQFGIFSNLENAAISSAAWQSRGHDTYVVRTKNASGNEWYAVRTGAYRQQSEGADIARDIRNKEDAPAVLVQTPLNEDGSPEKLAPSELASITSPAQESTPEPELRPELPEATPTGLAEATNPPVPTKKGTPRSSEKARFAVQLGAFSNQQNAQMALEFWRSRGLIPYLVNLTDSQGHGWLAVRSGEFRLRRDASALALQLGRKEKISALVVAYRPESTVTLPATPTAATTDTVKVAEAPAETPAPLLTAETVAESAPTQVAPPAPTPVTPIAPVAAPTPPAASEPTNEAIIAPEPPSIATEPPAATPPTGKAAVARKAQAPRFSVQLGAFATIENAAAAYAEWINRGYAAYVCEMADRLGKLRFAVRVGAHTRRQEGLSQVRSIHRQSGTHAVLVPALLDEQGKLATIDVAPLLNAAGATVRPLSEQATPHVR